MADEKNDGFGKRFKKVFWALIIGVITVFICSYVGASMFIFGTIKIDDVMAVIAHQQFKTIFLIVFLIAFVTMLILLSEHKFGSGNSSAKVTTKGGMKKFYDTNWLSIEELRTNKDFKFHYYEDLHRSDNVGIPIRAEMVKNRLEVNMYKPIHTLVIGTTGSGKTTQFVDPTMQILSESKARPCIVVTDPKGEIYDNHSQKLRKNGYRVLVFDLKEPFQSSRWNPLTRAYELNERACNLNREVVVHHNDDPRDFGLKCTSDTYYSEWYEFDGFAFADVKLLQNHQSAIKQKLQTDAFEDLKDIAAVLCPIPQGLQ